MRTLIRAATVVDGTETPRYQADVLVDGDRIAEIHTAATDRPSACLLYTSDDADE